MSRTEIYGLGLAVHESCRLMDDHPRLLEDFLDLTLNLVAEYDREGDGVPQHLRDCAVYGLLSGEPKFRDIFRSMLLFGENNNETRVAVREMKHEMSRKLRVLLRFDWKMLSRQYFLSVILDELLRSVQAERGSGDGDSAALRIRVAEELNEDDSNKISKGERSILLLKQARTLLSQSMTDESVVPALRRMIYASPKLCHCIFSELFPVVWSNLPRCDREALSDDLVAFLSKSWHDNQPRGFLNVAKSVFSALPEDVLLNLPIDLIAHLGRHHNCWFVSINALESILSQERELRGVSIETLLQDEKNVFEVDTKRRVLEVVRHLESLYEDLNMKDLAFAVRRSYAQSKTSKIGLTMETYGFVQEAHEVYSAAIQDASSLSLENNDTVEEERVLWEKRWVTCSKQLLRWETLSQFAKSTQSLRVVSSNRPTPTLDDTHTGTQDDQLRLDCALKLGHWTDVNILKGLVADESTPRNRLGVLCASVLGSNSSALSHVVDSNMHLSNEALIREWQSLPLEISEAHVPLLHTCQRLVEVREALKIVRKIAQSKKISSVPDLKSVLSTWRERLPNKFDDTTAWSDIMKWRDHTFKYITKSFTPEDALRHQLHDAPWTVIKLAHIARRHGLQRVSLTVLNRLSSYRQMDIQDAFEKLREQILICLANAKKPLEIKSGIRFINDTNLEYFQSNLIGRSKKISQKAEFFRLKSKFLVALGENDLANENFSKCMRICDNFSKGWYTWACFLDKQYEKTGDIKVAAQAVCGFLQAVNHNTEGARLSLARVIWLMSNDDENGTIRETFQNYGDRMPLWIWCVWIPQLLTALIRDEASKVRSILLHISTVYPQALYYTLRAFLLEKRELPLSSPKDEETKEEENTKIDQDSGDEDVSTKRSTDETGIMPSVAMSILRMQGLFRGYMFRKSVRENAAALLIQSAWRGHRARIALHMMIDHMTNLLLSKGMDVLKEVSEIDNEKKVREDLV